MLYRIQSTTLTSEGRTLVILPDATVTVTDKTGAIAAIFSDADGLVPTANPFSSGGTGGYDFYVNFDDFYDILTTSDTSSVDERVYPLTYGEITDHAAAAAASAQDASDDAASAAASAASIAPYPSRAAAIAATIPAPVISITVLAPDGTRLDYKADPTGTALTTADGRTWSPIGVVRLEHFGAIADGRDNAAAWEAAMDYLESLGGGELELISGEVYRSTSITIASNVTLRLNGATLAVHPSMPKTGGWMVTRDLSVDGTRACNNPRIIGPGVLSGYDWAFDRWLSKLDGTPVTNPEADYVMGSGELASGISGVALSASVNSGKVDAVAVVAGGSGWNNHPVYPYIPNTVLLKFQGGGGFGAAGQATISGGTLTSVTISNGGKNYSSAPTVTTVGGYADIELLTTPEVDRRNPAYISTGVGISFHKTNFPEVNGVRIEGFKGRALLDLGCLNAKFRNIEFVDCGKNDGAFPCIWTQSYGSPVTKPAFYAGSEGTLIEDITAVQGIERSAVLFGATLGGTIRRLTAKGCGESTIFVPSTAAQDGGDVLIEDCDLSDNILTDIAAGLIETNAVKNLTVRDCTFKGSAYGTITTFGGRNNKVLDSFFHNNGTAASTAGNGITPFGPFSERFGFNQGEQPICGRQFLIEDMHIAQVGSLGSSPSSNVTYSGNTFSDNRSVYPKSVFQQTKSGSNSIAGDTVIKGNSALGMPSNVNFIDISTAGVWLPNMPLHIRGNLGHVSEAPVIVGLQVNATGLIIVNVGFRPSRVDVFAEVNNGARLRSSIGSFSWRRDGVRNDFVHNVAVDDTDQRGALLGQDVIRITSPTGVDAVVVEFASWQELGFTLNCVTYAELTNVRLICTP